MQALSEPLRLENGKDRDHHCKFCCGTGQVLVGWSQIGTDQLAPCPYCLTGLAFERAGWGNEGFWQGREIDGLEESCECFVPPLPIAEARVKLAGLFANVSANDRAVS